MVWLGGLNCHFRVTPKLRLRLRYGWVRVVTIFEFIKISITRLVFLPLVVMLRGGGEGSGMVYGVVYAGQKVFFHIFSATTNI